VPLHLSVTAASVDAHRHTPRGVSGSAAASRGAAARPDAVTHPGSSYRVLRAARDKSGAVRLSDAMRSVEPTWIEGVAVVQAVCAQLEPGETPPAIGDIVVSSSGAVSFPLGGISDADVAIQAMGRLLTSFLRTGGCPLVVWEATECARRSPMSFGSVRGFGAALTCFPALRGPQDLAAYVQVSRERVASHPRAAARGSRRAADPLSFVW
jgi:hypothetical protein